MLKFVALPILLLWTLLFVGFFTLGLIGLIADYAVRHNTQVDHGI
jgi:hypothetical protein